MKTRKRQIAVMAVIVIVAISLAVIAGCSSDGGSTSVKGVSLDKSALNLIVGETETLTATVSPANADNKKVTWISGDDTIATVSADGTVTPVKIGTTTITVTTADGNFTAQCAVTVRLVGMVQIPAGTFTMGSPDTEENRQTNETQHSVTLTKSFFMGKYEVTQEQYQAVMGSNPSYFTTAVTGENGTPSKLPVEQVSWYDAIVFCNKLSVMEGLSPVYSISGSTDTAEWGTVPTSDDTTWNAVVMDKSKNGYRLPTEAEWEYACRAGTTTAFNTGDTVNDNTGWYWDNNIRETHKMGLKPANAWGLYDMHGNVSEWCWDWIGTYASGVQTDPNGAVTGTRRVYRGGGWASEGGKYLRSAQRGSNEPSYSSGSSERGFRLVRGE
jgi:formylglycine-generating enzyme required for sulfatase activity